VDLQLAVVVNKSKLPETVLKEAVVNFKEQLSDLRKTG
jgi:hypothetical protein